MCKHLDLLSPSDAIKSMPEKHKARFNLGLRGQAPWLVTESGLYRLVMKSRKPEVVVLPMASDHRKKYAVTEAGLYRLVMRSNKPEATKFQD